MNERSEEVKARYQAALECPSSWVDAVLADLDSEAAARLGLPAGRHMMAGVFCDHPSRKADAIQAHREGAPGTACLLVLGECPCPQGGD